MCIQSTFEIVKSYKTHLINNKTIIYFPAENFEVSGGSGRPDIEHLWVLVEIIRLKKILQKIKPITDTRHQHHLHLLNRGSFGSILQGPVLIFLTILSWFQNKIVLPNLEVTVEDINDFLCFWFVDACFILKWMSGKQNMLKFESLVNGSF